MIDSIFYFKCAINLNETSRITCKKTKMRPLNTTFYINVCIEFPQGVQKTCFYTIIEQEERSKHLLLFTFKPNAGKTADTEKKH